MEWYVVVTATTVAVVTWVIVRRRPRSDREVSGSIDYTNRLINYLYFKLIHKSSKRFLYRCTDDQLFTTPVEEKLDKVQSLIDIHDSQAFDSIYFSGTDTAGNYILIKITRYLDRRTELWITIKTEKHGILTLPYHPETNIYNTDGESFNAAGLRCTVLEPMRRWRISFNGLLRQEIEDKTQTGDIIHVNFNFIWTAITIPFDCNDDISFHLLARSHNLSKERRYDQYEQWGQLYGTMNVDDEERDSILHFRGLRIHSFGKYDTEELESLVDINVYTRDATAIHVGAVKLIKRNAQVKFGHMFRSNGAKYAVTWSDLSSLSRHEKLECAFDTDRLHRLVIGPVVSKLKLLHGDKLQLQTEVTACEICVDDKKGFGFLQTTRGSNDYHQPMLENRTSLPLLKPLSASNPDDEYDFVTRTQSPLSIHADVIGGKGASLSLLHRLKDKRFKVPASFYVTKTAFHNHLQENDHINKLIQKLEAIAWNKTKGDLQEITHELTTALINTSITPDLQYVLHIELEKTFGVSHQTTRLAVRSSAIGEDGDDLSFAGQNDSFLGVTGVENVCDAIIKCWASQFSFTATEYKRQHGQLLNPGMGVVIQEMIPADVAGVLFTSNPNTGNPSQIIITANYGLGESVVSASVEPDTIILNRTYDDRLSIKEKILGSKSNYVIPADNDGLLTVETRKEKTSEFCISDEICLRLGEIGISVEKSFGSPRDIEWCILNDHIYLLQARPITSLDKATEFELTHEFDTSIKSDVEYSTKANTGEVFPDAATPLTISTIAKSVDLSIEKLVISYLSKSVCNPCTMTAQVMAYNHLLLNCIDLIYRNSDGNYTDVVKALEMSVFGRTLQQHVMYDIAYRRHYDFNPNKFIYTLKQLRTIFNNKNTLSQGIQLKDNYQYSFDKTNPSELYSAITDTYSFLQKIILCHCTVTSASTAWNLFSVLAMTGGKPDWSADLFSDIATLLASCSNVESSEIPAAMKELATNIAQDQEKDKFCSENDLDKAWDWLKNNDRKPGELFGKFIKNHGHRGLKEIDLYSKSWRMDARGLIQTLQNMAQNSSQLTTQIKHSSVKETISKLKTPTTYFTKKLISWILPRYRAAVGYRERSKSIIINVIDQLRSGYRLLSEMMTKEGFLPDADLVFFLTHHEIAQILTSRSAKLIQRATQRKRLHHKLQQLHFPEINVGLPKPIKDDSTNEQQILANSATKISGTPVCHGITKGLARVVTRLEDARSIQPNDILITYATDIGWSPFFPLLSGVVTEIGGIVSHGAVIAREYGLPCIVGAHNATRLFSSGDHVVLNGGRGLLQKLPK